MHSEARGVRSRRGCDLDEPEAVALARAPRENGSRVLRSDLKPEHCRIVFRLARRSRQSIRNDYESTRHVQRLARGSGIAGAERTRGLRVRY